MSNIFQEMHDSIDVPNPGVNAPSQNPDWYKKFYKDHNKLSKKKVKAMLLEMAEAHREQSAGVTYVPNALGRKLIDAIEDFHLEQAIDSMTEDPIDPTEATEEVLPMESEHSLLKDFLIAGIVLILIGVATALKLIVLSN